MAKFLLIRHGDTDYVDEALAGRIDSPLSEFGLEQSQQIAQALYQIPINAIYASPLKRTQQTANPLSQKLNLEVKIVKGLNQVDFGDWQGLSFDALIKDPRWETFQENPALTEIPGGENGCMVRERVTEAILQISNQSPQDATIAVFSHGSIIRHIVTSFIGMPLENLNQIRIAPASITTLEIIQDRGKLLHLNQEISINWI